MLLYLTRRLALSVLVIYGVLIAVFFMVNEIGDPALLMLPPGASEEDYLALRSSLGLDEPLFDRLTDTIAGWTMGDFGDSLWQRVPALDLALERIPATLYLTTVIILIAVPAALFLAFLAVIRGPNSISDRLVSILSLAGASIPTAWVSLMLILVFAVQLQWLPTSGYGGLEYVLLPALAYLGIPMGRIAQIAKAAMLDEMDKPYVVALRAKGMTESRIIFSHALKNAANPILTMLGGELASLVNGLVVIEVIFAWPGIGQLFLQAIQNRDLPLVTACVFVVAVMTILINLLVDLAYAVFDPRANVTAAAA